MSEAPDPILALFEHLAAAAAYVVSQIAGAELSSEFDAQEEPLEAATLVRVQLTGALEGCFELGLSATMSSRFSALLTGESPDAELTDDIKEAAAELIQQICGNAADRLRNAFGPLELKPNVVTEREAVNGDRRLLRVLRDDSPLEMELHIVQLQVAVQEAAPPAKPAAAPSVNEEPAAAAGVAVPAAPAEPTGNPNLDLLLDIELEASLRFGTRQMLLKDILELCSGSVVELDRGVQEPVDLLIDGRLIAQGEVVIVEGNYGLRVLQVASPHEKVACLPH